MATQIERAVTIPLDRRIDINGDLAVPDSPTGVAVFAHGSGSGRHSPRNRLVASYLQIRGLATLLIDLLTEAEEQVDLRTRHLRFDVELLAGRLAGAASWCSSQPELSRLQIGYFGASTGAAAALIAAADQPEGVGAVVSRGGRPDLAGDRLPEVKAPTLLIVGGRDEVVLDLNRQAERRLGAPTRLVVVPGATHLFEEPGALEQVSQLAGDWMVEHLGSTAG
ncbi:MAG TPA: dienelactone hydrolase family protein [Actinomycetota bacterium]|nr:dienelactone hydrolase family protein [Actinomycetota bacterium]